MDNLNPEEPICQHCGNGMIVCVEQGGCAEHLSPSAYCGSWGGLIVDCECWCCESERNESAGYAATSARVIEDVFRREREKDAAKAYGIEASK